MYYKKQGNEPPITKAGCTYDASFFYDGYLYLKYSGSNIPSEELTEITQEEYEANKPVTPEPEPEPTPQEIDYATLISKINELTLLVKGVS